MRSIHPRNVAKVKTLTSNYALYPRYFTAETRLSSSSQWGRRPPEPLPSAVKDTSWTQYILSNVSQPRKEASKLPKVTEDHQGHVAYVAFGSNLGDRINWIERACNEMPKRGIEIIRTSCLWETDPMYVLDQDKFVNGVCEVKTKLKPIELLDVLQDIEKSLGREKLIDKGPRNIDLDILLYENEIVDHERLKIPHALMFEREFVLRPLAELIPAKNINPGSPWKTTIDYLNALPFSPSPMTTLTPLGSSQEPIRALSAKRQTLVMAILNFTPDSFSNDGKDTPNKELDGHNLPKTIALKAKRGAKIIDVGGQSSGPGAMEVPVEEEIRRIVPGIQALRDSPDYKGLISIDTYRAAVAEAAVEAGADMINDVGAGTLDEKMFATMARLGKTVCLMHMRGNPRTMDKFSNYDPKGLIPTIAEELLDRVAAAEAAGIRRWRIILDPGIGFAKTGEHAVEILRRLDELRDWPGLRGLPWLIGASRKKFIGQITGVKAAKERAWGTAATVAAAIQGGADIIRVHDVGPMSRVAMMSDAIWRV